MMVRSSQDAQRIPTSCQTFYILHEIPDRQDIQRASGTDITRDQRNSEREWTFSADIPK